MFAMFVPTLITEVPRAIASAQANASPRPSLTSIASNPLSSAILPSSTNSFGGAAVAVDSTIPSRSVAIPDSSHPTPTAGARTPRSLQLGRSLRLAWCGKTGALDEARGLPQVQGVVRLQLHHGRCEPADGGGDVLLIGSHLGLR